MIKINGLGAPKHFNMPSASPFVIKTETLFKMAGIEYEAGTDFMDKSPKGKIPFIYDEQTNLGDSTFIRFYLEDKYGADFDAGYSDKELAIGWSLEKMCEEHLYFIVLHDRWLLKDNFEKGPKAFFERVPEPAREGVITQVLETQKNRLFLQGLGRHTPQELTIIGERDIDSIIHILGDNDYILGKNMCGYDASIHATLWAASCPLFDSEIGEYIRNNSKLMAYINRINQKFYKEYL